MFSALRHRRFAPVIALAFASVAAGHDRGPQQAAQGAVVRSEPDAGRVRESVGSSLSDAVRRVQRSTGGQILGAERVPFDGRDINRVKYMDGRGRVRYMDDPQPGRAPSQATRPSEPDQPPRDNHL
ncbi:hypothetical protein [Xanthomonas sp. MUS 060]|uniref:hypothetical protein n=1 Tax=Xanthomonas sp. MUS 060 TaxID=1588031 RepID=UPI001F427759|nr:hypothetical protein [Xanthomonas sp. MUS 060]